MESYTARLELKNASLEGQATVTRQQLDTSQETIVQLRCRIATLEAYLSIERQEKQNSQNTIQYLAKLLSKGSPNPAEHDPATQSPTSKISPLAVWPLLNATLRKNSEGGRATQTDPAEACNLPALQPHKVIFKFPPPASDESTSIPEPIQPSQGASGITAGPENQQLASHHSTPLIDISSPIKPVAKEEPIKQELRATAKPFVPSSRPYNRPPKLDLSFKGLRTAHDGALKDDKATSFETKWSEDTLPTLEEIVNKNSTAVKVNPVGNGIKSRGISEEKINAIQNSIAKFSATNNYGSSRSTTPVQRRSEVSSDNEYFRKPLFLYHGIHYKPREDDLFLNRSRVMIFNLPANITIAQLMSKIHGGLVISCQLLDTSFAYKGHSAIVRFSSYVEAMKCVDYATTEAIIFNDRTASFQLIPTPSYPLAPEIYKNIFERGHTRCLRIHEFEKIKDEDFRRHYTDPTFIEYQASNGCGDWFVRFTSIQRASALWSELAQHQPRSYSGFMPDPCDLEGASGSKAWKGENIKVMEIGELKWNDEA